MSNEYKYIIEIDPEALNKIDQLLNSLEGKGGVSSKETDFEEIKQAINEINGGDYYSETYTYDSDKLEKILSAIGENKSLSVEILAQLKGVGIESDVGDLIDKMDNLGKIDLFKITENLTELDAAIKTGAYEPIIVQDKADKIGLSSTAMSLSNESLKRIGEIVGQKDIRNKVEKLVSDPDAGFRSMFPETSEVVLRDAITKIVDAQHGMQVAQKEITQLREDIRKLDDSTLKDIISMEDAAAERNRIKSYIKSVETRMSEYNKITSKEGQRVTGSFLNIGQRAPAQLQKQFRRAGIRDELVLTGLDSLFKDYVTEMRGNPKVLEGNDQPIEAMLTNFLHQVADIEVGEGFGSANIKTEIDKIVDQALRKQVNNYIKASQSGDPAQLGEAVSELFPSAAGLFIQPSIPSAQASAARGMLEEANTMMTQLDTGLKAATGQINRNIEGVADGSEPSDRNTEVKEILGRIENIRADLSEKIEQLRSTIESSEPTGQRELRFS